MCHSYPCSQTTDGQETRPPHPASCSWDVPSDPPVLGWAASPNHALHLQAAARASFSQIKLFEKLLMLDVWLLSTSDLWGGEWWWGKRLLPVCSAALGFPSAAAQAAGEWAAGAGEDRSTLFGHQSQQKRLKDAR